MKTINSYKDLLEEEERIKKEIEISKGIIEVYGKEYIKPKNLFGFIESKVEKTVDHQFSGEFEFNKYLVGLSLDYLYDKAGQKIMENSPKQSSGMDWKLIGKSLIDKLYINNKVALTDAVSGLIDKGLEKIKK
ncbi:hypothetical protein [Brumimicrobium mesophilum]|uniref:hypothetical protein n=1 Tax=Brumimicrobium mesophilum TaxID=392717 RepID=UPI000D13FE2E|nr:hypothetical protein [Brumimicrobium mesophilum]